eukprot:209812-Prymnesium_polylepis.2
MIGSTWPATVTAANTHRSRRTTTFNGWAVLARTLMYTHEHPTSCNSTLCSALLIASSMFSADGGTPPIVTTLAS